MQIIIVDRRMTRAKTFTLSRPRLAAAVLALLVLSAALVSLLYLLTLRLAADVPAVQGIVSYAMRDQNERYEQYLQTNVSSMARMLGDMQARMMRLDALGERVSKLAGIRPEEFNFRELPGRGGPLPPDARPLSLHELQDQLARVGTGVDQRSDYMGVLESELVSSQARDALLPKGTPVSEGFVGSGYGMRTDPFTGQLAMHAGVDFAGPVGTPIYAAAGGVVVTAELEPAFGNTVEIDHGKGLSTVYAHTSRILVKSGDLVRKGQQIALVGTTGRSTGPHLHFEVHVNGQAQNPSRYLASLHLGALPVLAAAPVSVPAAAPVSASAAASAAAPAADSPAAPAVR